MEDFYLKLLRMYEILNTNSSTEDLLDYIYKSFKEYLPYDRVGLVLIIKESKTDQFNRQNISYCYSI